MPDYRTRLLATRAHYPFVRWEANGEDLEQYTPEACAACAAVFDLLIDQLIAIGEDAPEDVKLEFFREAVEGLNTLYEEDTRLIETGEAEDLCALCNVITVAAGLDPKRYGGGEGPASEWRSW